MRCRSRHSRRKPYDRVAISRGLVTDGALSIDFLKGMSPHVEYTAV